mmetsp:Transcript_1794/g.3832  ORF Transcript_1794/g.3832 Transcript_1794/m.3832 type:complete len:81 (-) Transcript_1794:375-617(-)
MNTQSFLFLEPPSIEVDNKGLLSAACKEGQKQATSLHNDDGATFVSHLFPTVLNLSTSHPIPSQISACLSLHAEHLYFHF